jgi:hypothetical protein
MGLFALFIQQLAICASRSDVGFFVPLSQLNFFMVVPGNIAPAHGSRSSDLAAGAG